MFCLACTAPAASPVCRRCALQLGPAPERMLGGGLLAVGAFTHEGPAKALVHALKYRGVTAAALPFAVEMAERLPPAATGLIPVPRALGRAVRYGVDPAAVLARAVSRITSVPVVPALQAPWWWRRHAGASRDDRQPISFRRRLDTPPGMVLVDDVVTTGATVVAAASALRNPPGLVLAATVAPWGVDGRSTSARSAAPPVSCIPLDPPKMAEGDRPSGGRVIGAPAGGTYDQTHLRAPPFDDRPHRQGREFE